MNPLERIAEERIRRALKEGAFDDLPGKGQPLRLDDNPFEPAEWRAAFRLLRAQGFSLPWMEERRQIEAEVEAAQQALLRAWQARERDPEAWERARARYLAQVRDLNRRIRDYNLSVPSPRFQRRLLPLDGCDTLD